MPAGLFALSCADCESPLELITSGLGRCTGCGHVYLYRFGHLIPVADPRSSEVVIRLDEPTSLPTIAPAASRSEA